MPDWIKEMEVAEIGSVKISDFENFYSYTIFNGKQKINSKFFIDSIDIAKKWLDMERKHPQLRLARKAISVAPTIKDSGMCLMQIWQGIESLFEISQELSFRVSLLLSLLVGEERKEVYDASRVSYTIRSNVAHGRTVDVTFEQLLRAWHLLVEGMHAIVRRNHLPKEKDLMSELF
ncbi:hypothetical protein L2W58_06050 [Dethiosulfovibrio sp. F2B]|uniref:HEPN domain-containing protein n=1 Tax=Dethiosulfovibrio faecalis TaxID=2720018 RepID=UPI001EEB0980|nr:HEPN domain-containing protein [Dethiosulfovibrio faecalis]MCF4151361.1 hypothetical protein [Dethiosulfovibrio faecalis]